MNKNDLHRYLLTLDQTHSEWVEYPEEFDYKSEIEKIKSICLDIELLANLKCNIDDQVQDAFFFAQITFIDEHNLKISSARVNIPKGWIRFSNFGHLVTHYFENELDQAENLLSQKIVEILERREYIHANSSWLMATKYDGIHQYFHEREDSWWYRFFDYM